VKPPAFDLPLPLARAALALAGPFYRLRKRRPPFSSEQLDNLERNWAFSDARARAELDWQPRGLDAGLPPTVEMLRTQ
jgi:nucleoside-diphosphate-sugar epimerase